MTLIVNELYDTIVFEQPFRIKKSMSIAHIRPWIYKHGVLASGDLTLQVLMNAEVLREVSINYADINTEIPGTYFHGFIRFDFEPLQLNHDRKLEYTEYTLKLFMDNYTNASTFIGAVRHYERNFYDIYGDGVVNNESPNDMVDPLGFEIFKYTY